MQNLTCLRCPLCREVLRDCPEHIQNKIIENEKVYRQEMDDEAFENLRINEEELSRYMYGDEDPNKVIMRMLRIECLSAIQLLKECGVPITFIPLTIDITIPQSNIKSIRPGMLFGTIIDSIMGTMFHKCINNETIIDVEEPQRSQEDFDDNIDYYPFFKEDLIANSVPRKILIKLG